MEPTKTDTQYYKICVNCNFFCNLKEPDEFCSLCGNKLIDNCPSCGKKLTNPYARFCKHCGAIYPGRGKSKDDKGNF